MCLCCVLVISHSIFDILILFFVVVVRNRGEGELQFDRSSADRLVMYSRIIKGLVEFPSSLPSPVVATLRLVRLEFS